MVKWEEEGEGVFSAKDLASEAGPPSREES
jgi:hypothetical protein